MSLLVWAGFLVLVVAAVTLDLFVINRHDRRPTVKHGLVWTGFWIACALAFSVFVYAAYSNQWLGLGAGSAPSPAPGAKAMREFLAGWLIEYSLSVDNLFVIAMIFAAMRVPPESQRRVLFWGILGAVVMRGVLIVAGMSLLALSHWFGYVFGVLLLLSALKMLISREENIDPSRSIVVRTARRFYPVSAGYEGRRFFTRFEGRRAVTPLFVALLMVESADLIFALDSIPAIFTITNDPFIAFSSNVFAVFGLRSLFFALAGLQAKFRFVKLALAVLLVYISVKMMLKPYYEIPIEVTLGVIFGLLSTGVIASMLFDRHLKARALGNTEREEPPLGQDVERLAKLTLSRAKKLIILVIGLTTIGLSIPIGLLPGPGGIAVFIVGLAILASEFIWARRLLKRVRTEAGNLATKADEALTKTPRPWLIPIVFAATIVAVVAILAYTNLPPLAVIFAALGPLGAEAVWAYRTMKRYRELRDRPSAAGSAPLAESPRREDRVA
jgi:tellurite resistance protein TerC